MNSNYYAILMAGGVGSRFWPVSTAECPKQFQDILGSGETLIQTTFARLKKIVPPENIYILTNARYEETVKEQISGIKREQIVLEPVMRDTAPSILLAALKIQEKNKDAVMMVAPSDHWIQGVDSFINDLNFAFEAVDNNEKLITLGIKPTFPNTGYGYIKFEHSEDRRLIPVAQFTEKPTFKKAEKFVEDGNYAWNAGIFIWNASSIIENFKKYLPEMYNLFQKGKEYWNTEEEQAFINDNYHLANKISIDYGIIEKAENVFMIPANFGWNDLGTWGSLQEELPQDDFGNTVINARLLPFGAEGNIVRAAENKIVVLEGLKDYIVLENEQVLLIVPKKNEQGIKEIRQKAIDKFGDKLG
ncbi:mannose-1-phosphate guanylyltransferase [Salegentibacter sp. F188]|uniref:Mannose-1-phosphate guanylyltransferase n=1 Tax=Autumnicola patrickiae TaxID=3075591 RepID=A0ABU3DZT4_9FLAO|nr:mannose-1-phosphate guanylyltransferase [Salegentibacter sp. F188]MDT0689223.1 mannose-1-phosphate guanylyltransferase [Salegentibacter sp. F188]